MFKQAQFSDISIFIHGKALPAHQFVVCIQSKFFENAFREDNFAEGETKTMSLDAATEAAYWRVFEYMYTGDYPDQLTNIETEGTRPTHVHHERKLMSDRRLEISAGPACVRISRHVFLRRSQAAF